MHVSCLFLSLEWQVLQVRTIDCTPIVLPAGGAYYKGVINRVLQDRPRDDAPEEVKEAYDPWDAIEVTWDVAKTEENDCEYLCPWELEVRPPCPVPTALPKTLF